MEKYRGYCALGRFGGREVFVTMRDLEKNPEYFNLDKIRSGSGRADSLTYEADRARRQAQGISTNNEDQAEGENEQYVVTLWLTHIRIDDKSSKCILELANDRSLVIRITPIEEDSWPLVKRDLYPMSNSWDDGLLQEYN